MQQFEHPTVSNTEASYFPGEATSTSTMAKKRKIARKAEPTGPREVDPKDARLTIRTYEDVADSQDEYWMEQDRIELDDSDGPRSKRLKRQQDEDAFLSASDEEILRGEDSESESDEEEEERAPPPKKKAGKAGRILSDEEDGNRAEEEEGDEGWWGSSKKEYYNADQIETEADALVC